MQVPNFNTKLKQWKKNCSYIYKYKKNRGKFNKTTYVQIKLSLIFNYNEIITPIVKYVPLQFLLIKFYFY